ncbi:MAG TPA: polysaccharide biosynthesis/export family protein [Verrucomicrobiae bacterium]|nr:polysaccharide biosynthesis/export family protein [Verrucomicrobiae bacterium]
MTRNMMLGAAMALGLALCPAGVRAQEDPAGVPAPSSPALLSSSSAHPSLQRRDARYRLCASDVIAISFPLTPEFDQTVNIQPDGFVSLLGAGDLKLEGLTLGESENAVKTAYSKILRDPLLTIELKDFNKPYFIVGGQVAKPGKYDLRGETTATQAIEMAGGFNTSAKHSQVLLFRRVNDAWDEVKVLDAKHILAGKDVNEDPEIQPGDMLYVPQNFVSKIDRFIPRSGVGAYFQTN